MSGPAKGISEGFSETEKRVISWHVIVRYFLCNIRQLRSKKTEKKYFLCRNELSAM